MALPLENIYPELKQLHTRRRLLKFEIECLIDRREYLGNLIKQEPDNPEHLNRIGELTSLAMDINGKIRYLLANNAELVGTQLQFDAVCKNYADRKQVSQDFISLNKKIDDDIQKTISAKKPDPSKGHDTEYKQKIKTILNELNLGLIYGDYQIDSTELINNAGMSRRIYIKRSASPGFNIINYLVEKENSTLVRFTYQDDATPIRNRFILYWLYDDDTGPNVPERIEYGEAERYKRENIMLPIGLGKTDDLGFLRQGVYVEDINAQKTQIYTHNNNSFIFVPPKVLPYAVTMEEMPYSFTPQKLNPFHSDPIQLINQTSDFYFDANGILTTQHDFLKKDWRRQLLLADQYTFERHLPKLNLLQTQMEESYRLLVALTKSRPNHFYEVYSFYTNWDEIPANKNNLDSLASDAVRNTIVDTVNQSKNHQSFLSRVSQYSFDLNRRYGFLVYPGDAGAFQTIDLVKLGNYSFQTKGKLDASGNVVKSSASSTYQPAFVDNVPKPPSDKDLADYIPIPLYCTLPEWAYRLREKTAELKLKFRSSKQPISC